MADEEMKANSNQNSWNLGAVGWGLFLVLVGVLALLANFGTIQVDVGSVLRLWPLFIIMAGFSILPVRGWPAKALGSLLLVAILALVMAAALGWVEPRERVPMSSTATSQQTLSLDSGASVMEANIKSGAGRLRIGSDSQPLVTARTDNADGRVSLQSRSLGGVQAVDVALANDDGWWRNYGRNNLQVTLPQQTEAALLVEAGAADIDADLRDLQLRSLALKSGASSISIRIGDKQPQAKVSVEIGASSLKLSVPRASGLRFVVKSGLSSQDLPGLRQIEPGIWETDNYDVAASKVEVEGSLGLSSLNLDRY